MKIAWFSPFTKKSAIGKISALICEQLAREHDVEIWTQHTEDLIKTRLPVVSFRPDSIPALAGKFDHIFYNLGNFAGYHREIMDVIQKNPGIVILHDQTMANFWGQYYCVPEFGGSEENGIAMHRALFRECYGVEQLRAVEEASGTGRYPDYNNPVLEGYPFLEASIKNATGVFTHSRFFAEKLHQITNLPVGYSYLPYKLPEKKVLPKNSHVTQIIEHARAEGRKILVSSGIVHPIKRIDKITEIFVENPALADQFCYLVVGGYGGPFGEYLEELSKGALEGCLFMLGYQPDDVMEEALQCADLAINLRYPNSEVCSLSLWEQMGYEKPVLVLDRGIYGEVPQDTVLRIHLETEKEEATQILKDFARNKLDLSVGKRAAAFLRKECNVSVYCRRLLDFADGVEMEREVSRIQDQTLQHVGQMMRGLQFNEKTVPASYAAVTDQLANVFSGAPPAARGKVLGIWIGFPYFIPNLSREGISRLMRYLVSSMLRYHPDVRMEIWCYAFNEKEVRVTFASVRKQDMERMQFITEKNWAEELGASSAQKMAVGEINEREDTLVKAVRAASHASVFVPLILYLDRIAEAGKKLFVPGYDMAVAEHYGEFIKKDPLYIARNLDYIWRAENLAARGGGFFCISDTVRQSEILKFIPNLKETDAHVIYSPPNIPEYDSQNVMSEAKLREQFSLHGRYLFYPTQIRPHKNISTLAKAFSLLLKEEPELQLVLTGDPKDVPEVEETLRELDIDSNILLLRDVPEAELCALYNYAAAIPVVSVFEGGFPLQALEALRMKAPVLVADIPVVRERICSLGFRPEKCGLPLFEPSDVKALASVLRKLLSDRKGAVKRQKKFADKILSYTWKEAAAQYYHLFFRDND